MRDETVSPMTSVTVVNSCQNRALLRQDDMGGVGRCSVLRALVSEADRIDAGEEVLTPAQKDR